MSPEHSAASIAQALGSVRRVGDEYVCTCPLAEEHAHGDANPSLYLKDASDGKVLAHCRSRHANEQDRVIEALKARGLWPSGDGVQSAKRPAGPSGPQPKNDSDYQAVEPIPPDAPSLNDFIDYLKEKKFADKPVRAVTRFDYRDDEGWWWFSTLRFDFEDNNKDVLPACMWVKRSTGRLVWRSKWPQAPRPLYGLDVLEHNPDKLVLVLEGEGKCDAANRLEDFPYVAVAWSGGAQRAKESDFSPLAQRKVVVWPDHDESGFKAAIEVTHLVEGAQLKVRGAITENVQIVKPDLTWPLGYDIGDLIKAGWSAEQLANYIEAHHADLVDSFKADFNSGRFRPKGDAKASTQSQPVSASQPDASAAPVAAQSSAAADLSNAQPNQTVSEFKPARADEVSIEMRNWFWPGRLQRGNINNLTGDPGDGKSLMLVVCAFHASTGTDFYDGSKCSITNTLILAGEESLKFTIGARLKAAGVDRSKVFVWALDNEQSNGPLTFPSGIEILRDFIEQHQIKLVEIDPFEGFLDDKLDPNNNPNIRKALSALARLAATTDCCILLIRHLNKDPKMMRAKYRASGSIGILGAARCNWQCGPDPDDAEFKIFAPVKNNDVGKISTLRYQIVETTVTGSNGQEILTPEIEWLGETEATADQSLAAEANAGKNKPGREPAKQQTAKEFLREVLGDGNYHDEEELKEQAKERGIKKGTLWNAKNNLGVKADKKGFAGGWRWYLPQS
jgi:hypothetical protein